MPDNSSRKKSSHKLLGWYVEMKELLWFKVKHVNQVKPKNLLSWLLCDLPVNTNMNS